MQTAGGKDSRLLVRGPSGTSSLQQLTQMQTHRPMTGKMEPEQLEMGAFSSVMMSNKEFRKSRAKLMRTKTTLSSQKRSIHDLKAGKLVPSMMSTVMMPEFRMVTKRNSNSLLKQSSVLNQLCNQNLAADIAMSPYTKELQEKNGIKLRVVKTKTNSYSRKLIKN